MATWNVTSTQTFPAVPYGKDLTIQVVAPVSFGRYTGTASFVEENDELFIGDSYTHRHVASTRSRST